MDKLIESLPENLNEWVHAILIYNAESEESNVCTKLQVAAMKEKGWMPYYWDSETYMWLEYEGMDEDANAISQPTIEGIDENVPIYNLAGQRIETLQGKKGVYIIGGKKVLIQ